MEAVVAMGIMAFGMLGLLGVQATLRSNSDISKQRSEAVRIAQEFVEEARAYSQLESSPGAGTTTTYTNIGPVSGTEFVRGNATYTRTVEVTDLPLASDSGRPAAQARHKQLHVQVNWTDRTGATQTVRLNTIVNGTPPELTGALTAQPGGSLVQRPSNRHPAIPKQAQLVQEGEHAGKYSFSPPQQAGGLAVWYFDGSTAQFVTNSDPAPRQLLSGYLRFAKAGEPLADQALTPSGSALNLDVAVQVTSAGHGQTPESPVSICYDDAPADSDAAVATTAVAYYCGVRIKPGGTWSGRARVQPKGFGLSAAWSIASSGAGNHKICRYTTMTADGFVAGDGKTNADHPLSYVESVGRAVPFAPLTNQNFLLIEADLTCPIHAPTAGETANPNTRLHQDGTPAYNNPP